MMLATPGRPLLATQAKPDFTRSSGCSHTRPPSLGQVFAFAEVQTLNASNSWCITLIRKVTGLRCSMQYDSWLLGLALVLSRDDHVPVGP